ncbi:MAG: hypothetical protein K6F53_02235 [Lachnospiraceae bacterium]|nr:hypothetical protein [Lachnospiraceae bacterium]
MGFFYQEDEEEFDRASRSFSPVVMRTIAGVSVGILVILLIVLAANNRKSRADRFRTDSSSHTEKLTETDNLTDLTGRYENDRSGKDIEELYREGKLRAEDLDIWDMYRDGGTVHRAEPDETPLIDEDPDRLGPYEIPEDGNAEEEDAPEGEDEDREEGADPSAEALIDGVKLNTVDHTKLRIVNDQMSYYPNGDQESFLGVDLSAENGNIDFEALRNAGVTFVMLRAGGRGYDSGIITEDPTFERNLKGAEDAGMKIGLTFSSRAINVDEAVEEAFFCLEKAQGHSISYPIAYVFEGEKIDSARTDVLDAHGLTRVAEAFMNTIRSNGYNTILYGTEDYLLNRLLPKELLTAYDVWLFDTDNMPHYPYQYKLWRYRNNVTVPGVESRGSYDISFVDYAGR